MTYSRYLNRLPPTEHKKGSREVKPKSLFFCYSFSLSLCAPNNLAIHTNIKANNSPNISILKKVTSNRENFAGPRFTYTNIMKFRKESLSLAYSYSSIGGKSLKVKCFLKEGMSHHMVIYISCRVTRLKRFCDMII